MYKLLKHFNVDGTENSQPITVQRLSDGAIIPFDPANTDYIAYLKWIEEGNTVLPADEGTQ